jgi:hypothetical protein
LGPDHHARGDRALIAATSADLSGRRDFFLVGVVQRRRLPDEAGVGSAGEQAAVERSLRSEAIG